MLFAPTAVAFRSALGELEDGDDRGGLTAEMYSLFWQAALHPDAGLFEGTYGGTGHLPAADAPAAALEAVGALLTKCIIDDHPIGCGLCPVVYDHLVFAWGGEGAQSLREVDAALRALRDFVPVLSESWRGPGAARRHHVQ